jgi:hypothetical protein
MPLPLEQGEMDFRSLQGRCLSRQRRQYRSPNDEASRCGKAAPQKVACHNSLAFHAMIPNQRITLKFFADFLFRRTVCLRPHPFDHGLREVAEREE